MRSSVRVQRARSVDSCVRGCSLCAWDATGSWWTATKEAEIMEKLKQFVASASSTTNQ